ncbi:MAG TPA: septal ring lytic transglycosylase RlpA family protein [Solirubrobacterales bacterium]
MVVVALAVLPDAAPAKPAHKQRPDRSDSHVSLHLSSHNVLYSDIVRLRGRVRPGGSRRVKIVVRGPNGLVVGLTSRSGGAFEVRWKPTRSGVYSVRAYSIHDRRVKGSASPARRITAYRPAAASYYGPGLYGGALACGGTLQPDTLGVAHRTLPCGSRVRLRYRGRTISVPVIDRGPYAAGRDFDLTEATKARLGFPDLGVLLSSR